MSFDLAFWWEGAEISTAEAVQKYRALAEGGAGVVTAHHALDEFYRDVVARHPELDDETLESSPWTGPLHHTEECAIVPISIPRQRDLSEFLLGLARQHGITAFDPQSGRVHFPGPNTLATLQLANGSAITGPSETEVTEALRRLSPAKNWHAILETEPGWYLQVGLGANAAVPAGTYAVELREGSAEKHFRALTEDRERVVEAFTGFLSGESTWRSRLPFSRLAYF